MLSPERLVEIRQQAADKFPSWTAMRDLLAELDELVATIAQLVEH